MIINRRSPKIRLALICLAFALSIYLYVLFYENKNLSYLLIYVICAAFFIACLYVFTDIQVVNYFRKAKKRYPDLKFAAYAVNSDFPADYRDPYKLSDNGGFASDSYNIFIFTPGFICLTGDSMSHREWRRIDASEIVSVGVGEYFYRIWSGGFIEIEIEHGGASYFIGCGPFHTRHPFSVLMTPTSVLPAAKQIAELYGVPLRPYINRRNRKIGAGPGYQYNTKR